MFDLEKNDICRFHIVMIEDTYVMVDHPVAQVSGDLMRYLGSSYTARPPQGWFLIESKRGVAVQHGPHG